MKTPRFDSDDAWRKLLERARADATPPVNVPALLRAVREARPTPRVGWAAELATMFAAHRVVPACLAAASAMALLTAWQVWEWWHALPWAQLITDATGGGS